MASTNKCEYCGSTITSDERTCPNCGATNPLFVADTPKVILTPHTIDELKEYCAERGMPLLRMRFFIGEDFKEPKAFGIYRDGNEFVVYKNKDDGSRAIRYRGTDEQHAVSELYLKLLDECHKRNIWPDTPDGKPPKVINIPGRSSQKASDKKGCALTVLITAAIIAFTTFVALSPVLLSFLITLGIGAVGGAVAYVAYTVFRDIKLHGNNRYNKVVAVIIAAVVVGIATFSGVNKYRHPNGYYRFGDQTYYRLDDSWYVSDGYYSWSETSGSITDEISDYGREYYEGSTYGESWSSDWSGSSFESTDYYRDYQTEHSSSSSDSDSSYDSWDSGSTDWGSDW